MKCGEIWGEFIEKSTPKIRKMREFVLNFGALIMNFNALNKASVR